VGRPEGKGPLRRPKRRGAYNIEIDLGTIEWSTIDCFDLAQERDKWRAFVNMLMKFLVR
jgi:hypothetical protein